MFCRNCGAELEQGQAVCPSCGQKTESSDKTLKIAVAIACVLLLAAVLVVVVLKSLDVFDKEEKTPEETVTQTEDVTAEAADFPSFAVDDATAAASMDEVIATAGDYELTNGQFQVYYWFQVYNYHQKYRDYIYAGYISLDYTKPLSKQACFEDPTISWEQFFVDKALDQWHSYAIMNMLADEAGYELPEDVLTDLRADLQADAEAAGYKTIEELHTAQLAAEVGPGTNAKQYWDYQVFVTRAGSFYADWYEKNTPTADELEAYYTENEKTFVDGGAGKDAGYTNVDVRHILVMVNEDTDAAWKAAEEKANKILQEWKDGGATEELFAELANQYSEDDGSKTNGGMYTNVQPGQMVEIFNDWITDASRQHGDTDILKADYHYQGYHIMYFVKGDVVWETAVRQTMMAEKGTTMLSDALKNWPVEKLEDMIKLGQPYK